MYGMKEMKSSYMQNMQTRSVYNNALYQVGNMI